MSNRKVSDRKLSDNTFTANSAYITPYKGCKRLVSPTSALPVPPCNKQRCNQRIRVLTKTQLGEIT